MKRRIEPEQLLELTNEQRQKLQNWWVTELGDYMTDFSTEEDGRYFVGICKYIKPNSENRSIGFPLLDIGQMIELLGDKWYDKIFYAVDEYIEKDYKGELCDALWQAVKQVI
jgi:hypothetical protein